MIPNTTGVRVDDALATTGEHSLSTTAERKAVVDAPGEAPTKDWVIVTRDKSLVENEVIAKKSSAIEVIPGLRVWTDDYNNLFDILK